MKYDITVSTDTEERTYKGVTSWHIDDSGTFVIVDLVANEAVYINTTVWKLAKTAPHVTEEITDDSC